MSNNDEPKTSSLNHSQSDVKIKSTLNMPLLKRESSKSNTDLLNHRNKDDLLPNSANSAIPESQEAHFKRKAKLFTNLT